ncbi:activator-dependent family glycosyltransferase [Amycolatopsis rubida]|uniref:Activator-dependent family glycosyltransferase n=1 Tax=Amycolatopsis rubida TaxID=112413 RepID=A0ABX0BMC3_9PSEU|nr:MULTISPECIES: activator-dependent family glycosyltransferase [Amycolatopsis]MYW90668.1 activator-dependent family glycosyltransferase [Amycolatopsis rubida]NEC55649.1 activator-dependent family glycosyltransferase [Amycolatopsis rubida]OAP20944.1 Desosaminyl transferase EryCIII precursor [Amycolatopsis sp. M39]
MRVLFLTVANRSHLHIATPFAWALRTAGHEVLVAAQPDLAETIGATGLTGLPAGDLVEVIGGMNEAEPVPAAPPPGAPGSNPVQDQYAEDDPAAEFETLVARLYPLMCPDSLFEDLIGFARTWRPDLVVWDMLTYAGPVVAQACGAAHARLVLATDGVAQVRSAFLAGRRGSGRDPMRDWLGPKLARHGGEFSEETVLGQWTLDLMPAWTWHAPGVNYLPVRHVPFNGPAMVPDWLREPPDRPRVCLTLGNSHREAGRAEASPGDLLAAVAGLDIEVVATLTAEQAGPAALPGNVRAVDFVPLNFLLPSCSAIVHHGGAGTFASAVEHGVPQLITPSCWWTEKWYGPVAMANGLEKRGAGIYVGDSDTITPDALRGALVRLLDDRSYQANAARLREEALAVPTPNDIVPELERLTAAHRKEIP